MRDMLSEIAEHGVFGSAVRTVLDAFDGDLPKHMEELKSSSRMCQPTSSPSSTTA